MADLNIRNVPEYLIRKVKAMAAQDGQTMRVWILGRLSTPDLEPGPVQLLKPTGSGPEKVTIKKARPTKKPEPPAEDPRFANVDGVTEEPKVTVKCPKPGHVSFRRNGEWWCLNCEKGE